MQIPHLTKDTLSRNIAEKIENNKIKLINIHYEARDT
jgi:hypothetical protein